MEAKNIYKKLFEVKKAGIKLQRDTKAFNYKYATLSQIQEKLNPIFEEQKLLVIHMIIANAVTTSIIDIESGDKVDSYIEMAEGTKPQDKGSEITYYRRYNLLSLLDLEVEDDDGAKAQGRKKETKAESKGEYKGKFELMDYIQRIKEEDDVNHLDIIYKEFTAEEPSEKQVSWVIKECKIRKDYLLSQGVDPRELDNTLYGDK